eukprot:IDg19995t1
MSPPHLSNLRNHQSTSNVNFEQHRWLLIVYPPPELTLSMGSVIPHIPTAVRVQVSLSVMYYSTVAA